MKSQCNSVGSKKPLVRTNQVDETVKIIIIVVFIIIIIIIPFVIIVQKGVQLEQRGCIHFAGHEQEISFHMGRAGQQLLFLFLARF